MKGFEQRKNLAFGCATQNEHHNKSMKPIALTLILGWTLVACSPQEEPQAGNQPVSIDKTQIDVAESDEYIDFARPGLQSRLFVLTNTVSQDDEMRWQRVKALSRRSVRITDGNEVLATGQIEYLEHDLRPDE